MESAPEALIRRGDVSFTDNDVCDHTGIRDRGDRGVQGWPRSLACSRSRVVLLERFAVAMTCGVLPIGGLVPLTDTETTVTAGVVGMCVMGAATNNESELLQQA